MKKVTVRKESENGGRRTRLRGFEDKVSVYLCDDYKQSTKFFIQMIDKCTKSEKCKVVGTCFTLLGFCGCRVLGRKIAGFGFFYTVLSSWVVYTYKNGFAYI